MPYFQYLSILLLGLIGCTTSSSVVVHNLVEDQINNASVIDGNTQHALFFEAFKKFCGDERNRVEEFRDSARNVIDYSNKVALHIKETLSYFDDHPLLNQSSSPFPVC